MTSNRSELSPALLTAQQKLHQLRQQYQARRPGSDLSSCQQQIDLDYVRSEPASSRVSVAANALPKHLGWESEPLSAALRAALYEQQPFGSVNKPVNPKAECQTPPRDLSTSSPEGPQPENTIKLHPDIALGMLRQEEAAAGRIWLLLRTIDGSGRGWISIKDARQQLTENSSPYRVCGWRQLRNLLSNGENGYWVRADDRIWLRSVAKVAAFLKVRCLTGSPVAIPVSALTQGMGTVRAHFYASFHSGRTTTTTSGKQTSMPIARETLRKLCRVSRRTQRQYEARTSVRRRRNYALGSRLRSANEQEAAWLHGHAAFRLTDRAGKQGPAGNSYLAWQLPNSYFGPHERQPRGQQKRINQELADLFTQGMTGNGEEKVEGDQFHNRKRFYGHGRLAVKAFNQLSNSDVYWRHAQADNDRRDSSFWFHLPGK